MSKADKDRMDRLQTDLRSWRHIHDGLKRQLAYCRERMGELEREFTTLATKGSGS